jgi:hypothetical protein
MIYLIMKYTANNKPLASKCGTLCRQRCAFNEAHTATGWKNVAVLAQMRYLLSVQHHGSKCVNLRTCEWVVLAGMRLVWRVYSGDCILWPTSHDR